MITHLTPTLHVVLADDHLILSCAIQEYLHRATDMRVVAIVERCADLDAVVEAHRPDLLLLDLSMEAGCSPATAIHRLRQIHPALKVVILSAHHEARWVLQMMEAQADGYVHKTEPLPVLIDTMHRVVAGEVWYSPFLINSLAAEYNQERVLKERERETLQAIADGMDLAVFSANMRISSRTVERHLANAIAKLGAHSRSEAVATALRLGMIQ